MFVANRLTTRRARVPIAFSTGPAGCRIRATPCYFFTARVVENRHYWKSDSEISRDIRHYNICLTCDSWIRYCTRWRVLFTGTRQSVAWKCAVQKGNGGVTGFCSHTFRVRLLRARKIGEIRKFLRPNWLECSSLSSLSLRRRKENWYLGE